MTQSVNRETKKYTEKSPSVHYIFVFVTRISFILITGFFSLFYGISAVVSYLMPKPSL